MPSCHTVAIRIPDRVKLSDVTNDRRKAPWKIDKRNIYMKIRKPQTDFTQLAAYNWEILSVVLSPVTGASYQPRNDSGIYAFTAKCGSQLALHFVTWLGNLRILASSVWPLAAFGQWA